MSSLILPGDWRRQPPPGVQVDSSNRLSRGLVEAIYPTRSGLTNVNGAQIVGVTGGLAFKGNGTNAYLWKPYTGPQITDQLTMLVVSHGAGTTSGVSLGVSSSVSATPFLRIRTDPSGASLGNFYYRTPESVLFGTSPATAFEDAKNHVLVATIGGGIVRFYVDGKLVDSNASSPTWAAGTMDLVTIGAGLAVSASAYQSAGTLLGCVWNTALAREDVIEISRNPWQIFRPIQRKIFVPVSAVGATAALSGSEATTSSGTLTPHIGAPIAGASSTTYAGALSPSLSVALAGNAATSAAGSLGVADVFAAALTGNSATTTAGSLSAAISLALMGNAATASAGALSVGGPIVVALTGNAATCYAGLLRASGASERSRLRQSSVFTRITQQRPVARITQQRLHARVADGH